MLLTIKEVTTKLNREAKLRYFSYFNKINIMLFFAAQLLFSAAYATESNNHKFKVVAYHVDLRAQIMPIKALKALANEISAQGFNTIVMEWEATYPYQEHRIIPNQYAYTREEIADFIKYSEGLGLDVIPLQQSLGHLEYILRHERYAYLRADKKDISQIDPTQLSAARALFTELYKDMLSTHHSQYVHIGGDETRILNCKRCQQAWGKDGEKSGKSKLYVEYMKMIAEIVTAQGKTPLIWADMILAYPDAIEKMPKNVIYVDWNYGWAFDHFGENPSTLIKKYGLTFWGAPAIRSWPDDYNLTTWRTHMNNQADYVSYAKEVGFEGMVLTSWSTSGEYSYEWHAHTEVLDVFAMRQVYPHSYPHDAFRMTTAAFIASINKEYKLIPQDFSQQYTQQRFGLTAVESETLWSILTSDFLNATVNIGSIPLSGEKGLPQEKHVAANNLAAVRDLQHKLAKIKPKKNSQEFSHYVMQVDIREFYLRFRLIQDSVQSSSFTESDKREAIKQLDSLLKDSSKIDNRFKKLFAGSLYNSEIDKLNQLRNKPIVLLHQRLNRVR